MIAGTQLATIYKTLTDTKGKGHPTKLPSNVDASIRTVLATTKSAESLTTTDATMTEIDRATDRCVASHYGQLEQIERSFDHHTILPLTKQQAARRDDAALVRRTVFPEGTSLLRLPYRTQWKRMTVMVSLMNRKDIAAAIERLGLADETQRVEAWVDLYGRKLGLTETHDADPAAVVVDAWHEAYGELVCHASSAFNPKDEEQARLRDALLAPYHQQADEERRASQKEPAQQAPAAAADKA